MIILKKSASLLVRLLLTALVVVTITSLLLHYVGKGEESHETYMTKLAIGYITILAFSMWFTTRKYWNEIAAGNVPLWWAWVLAIIGYLILGFGIIFLVLEVAGRVNAGKPETVGTVVGLLGATGLTGVWTLFRVFATE